MGFKQKGNELLVLSVFVLICTLAASLLEFVMEKQVNTGVLGAGCMLFVISLWGQQARDRRARDVSSERPSVSTKAQP